MPKFCSPCTIILLMLANLCNATSPDLENRFKFNNFSDWVCDQSGQYLCNGYYNPEPLELFQESGMQINANQTDFSPSLINFNGQVEVTGDGNRLFADHVTAIRRTTDGKITCLNAAGNINFWQNDYYLQGRSAQYWTITDQLNIDHANYRLYLRHAHGSARKITVNQKNCINLVCANYTTCAPNQITWQLSATSIDINRSSGRGVARHGVLKLWGIPVLYSPYFNFPIDKRRQTGFLLPSYSHSNTNGYSITVPFYWNIAPNVDATVYLQPLTKRGFYTGTELRYLLPNISGNFQSGFLPRDKQRKIDRFAFSTVHNFQPLAAIPNLKANIDYNYAHDNNYYYDLSNQFGVSNIRHLPQKFNLDYSSTCYQFSALYLGYQTLYPTEGPFSSAIYRMKPRLQLYQQPMRLPGGFYIANFTQFTNFTHFDPMNNTIGQRFAWLPHLSRPTYFPGGYFKPSLRYHIVAYELQNSIEQQNLSKNPTCIIPTVQIDSGLWFERNIKICNAYYYQTLEPRIVYLYTPYKNQDNFPNFDTSNRSNNPYELFQYNRFAGLDRIGDSNQISVGLSSRIFTEESGNEKFYVNVAQAFYFTSPRVNLINPQPQSLTPETTTISGRHYSPIIGEFWYKLYDPWQLFGQVAWDPQYAVLDQLSIFSQWRYQPRRYGYPLIFNLGYEYSLPGVLANPILKQIITSVSLPMNRNLRLLAKYSYDLHLNRLISNVAGLEWENCCLAIRVVSNNYLKPGPNLEEKSMDHRFMLQIVFKGLANVGSHQVDNTLTQNIPGYQWSPGY